MLALSLALFAAAPLGQIIRRARPRPATAATKLSFLAQPENMTVGRTSQRAVRVALLDASGKVATNARANISLSLASNSSGADLSGVLTQPAVRGIARFTGLGLDMPGRGYILQARANVAGAALSATSRKFNASIGTAVSLQFQPSTVSFGDSVTFAVAVSPCRNEYGGTAGRIQLWLARQMLGTAQVGRISAGCQVRFSVRFASPRFPAATYPLTVAFIPSNPDYGFSKAVQQLNLTPRQIKAEYTGKSFFAAAGPKAPVSLRAQISTVSSKSGGSDIFNRVNGGGDRVAVDFFNCSIAPCQALGRAPLRDLEGSAGTGIATLAKKLPVGVFALIFRMRQAANYFAASDLPPGQEVVDAGEGALVVAPKNGAGLRGAGWIPDPNSSSGKCWFAFYIRSDRGRVPEGNIVAIFPSIFESVPADVVIRSASLEQMRFLDQARNEAELTARASVSIINRASGEVVGGFAAPATPNLTMVVAGGKSPQFGLEVLGAGGASFATVGTSIGNTFVPVPISGGRIVFPLRP